MSAPMRILMVATYFHPIVGGAERQAFALAKALLRRGHSVCFATCRFPGLAAFEIVEGIPIHRVIRPVYRGAVYAGSYLASLMAFLVRWRRHYDLIHAHLLFLDAYAAGAIRAVLQKPVLAKAAGGGAFGDVSRLRRVPFSAWLRSGLRRVDRLVAPSREILEELIGHGFSATRIVEIPNGVDTEWFRPAADREAIRRALGLHGRVVSFAGRLAPEKGLPVLLEAWERVTSTLSDARLLLFGTGPQEQMLREQAQRLRCSDRVVFCGERPGLLPYFQASDLFVLPSLSEGMSNALLEAMACGRACIASRVGASGELITDGVNGLLVEPGDADGLAVALLRALADPEAAARLGSEARRTVEAGYSMTMVADRYVQLYQELIHRGDARVEELACEVRCS